MYAFGSPRRPQIVGRRREMRDFAQVKRWLLMGLAFQTKAEKKWVAATLLERPTNDELIREAISLIEASGDKANENKGAEKVLESGPHAEEPLVKPAAPPSPAPSPGPTIKKDLTVEVEEAMEELKDCESCDGNILRRQRAALAVIWAALTKP